MPKRRNPGELEAHVLRTLWHSTDGLTARMIVESFADEDHVPTLTTVLTVLDRLVQKGSVRRVPGTGENRFEPTSSESEHAADAMATALLSSADHAGALTYFAGGLDEADAEVLRRAIADKS